jgi:hypothetical protein
MAADWRCQALQKLKNGNRRCIGYGFIPAQQSISNAPESVRWHASTGFKTTNEFRGANHLHKTAVDFQMLAVFS